MGAADEPGRRACGEEIDLPTVRRWVTASTGREGTFWPGLAAAGLALAVAALLWPSAPRWSVWAVGWTALVVVIWVSCVLVDRPPGRRPTLDPGDYRGGDLPGQLLALARADQIDHTLLLLLRSARSQDLAWQLTTQELPGVTTPWPLHRLGRSWHEGPPPRARHPCWPQTIAIRAQDGTPFERCPCGGIRRRRVGSPWRQRNERAGAARRTGVAATSHAPVQPDR